MRQPLIAATFALTALVASVALAAPDSAPSAALNAAVAAPSRTAANKARDKYRHPAQTLAFFGVKPGDTVVEIWPGGGWYTEVLAPYLKAGGTLYEAGPWAKGLNGVKKLQTADAATYGNVRLAALPAATDAPSVPDGSADVVLTFRNVHNWRFGDSGDMTPAMFAAMYRMLKPGGTLGLVEHRLPAASDPAVEAKSGYMKVASVIGFAKAAGFTVEDMSEVNANPKDKANYPDGVWTLPPTYQLKDKDRAKYTAIGESDRMTIRFRKPKG